MSVRRGIIAPVLLLLATVGAREAEACQCSPSGPPCQAAWDADAIFVGTVRSIEQTYEEIGTSVRVAGTVVRFDVEQALMNASAGPVEIVHHGLSTCDYSFAEGQSYIVYARKNEHGRLTAGICSRTRPRAEAAQDLEFFRTLDATGHGARVYGRVTEWVHHPAEERAVDHGPLAHMTVNVRGTAFSHDLHTDRDGRYELNGVPLGPLSISVVTPFGLRAEPDYQAEVKDLRGCVAADSTVRAESASMRGLVVDAAGRPAPRVRVEAVAEELAGYQPAPIHTAAVTDDRGRFLLERLPPGAYVVGVNITRVLYSPPPGPPAFLPGTADPRKATVFDLAPGASIDVGIIRLERR